MARDYWFAFGPKPSATSGLAPTFTTFVNGSGATQAPPTISEPFVGSGLYKANYNPTATISFVLDGATTGLSESIRYIFGVFDPQDQFGTTLVNIANAGLSLPVQIAAQGTTIIAKVEQTGLSLIAQGSTNLVVSQTASDRALAAANYGVSNEALGLTGLAVGYTTQSLVVGIGNTLSTINVGAITGIGSTASPFGDNVTQPVTVFGYLKRVVEFLEGNQAYQKGSGSLTYSARGGQTLLASKIVSDSNTETTRT